MLKDIQSGLQVSWRHLQTAHFEDGGEHGVSGMDQISNLSLAQKHRPRDLQDIIGQDEIVSFLGKQIESKNGRSVLIHGRPGCGKTCIAEIYAAGLLCERPGKGPCHSCESCDAFRREIHPNLRMMRHGAVDDVRFAHQINDEVETESFGSGGLVVLIDQAQLLSERSFQILHERMGRPMKRVTYILCTNDISQIPLATMEQLYPLQVNAPTFASGTVFLERLCHAEGIESDIPALELIFERTRGSFRGIARDLEIIASSGAITEVSVLDYFRSGPAAGYVELVFQQERFEDQLKFLSAWKDEASDKIKLIRQYLGEIFEAASGLTANRPLRSLLAAEPTLAKAFSDRTLFLKAQPRAFAHRLLEIWEYGSKAEHETLLRKASEFDELLGGTKLEIADGNSRTILKPWRDARARTKRYTENDKELGKRVDHPLNGKVIEHLPYLKAKKLWDSASFLIQNYGQFLNTRISIRHDNLTLKQSDGPAKLITDLTHELRMFIKRSVGESDQLHWLYVHRWDDEQGLITDIVAHIPDELRDIEPWVRDRFFGNRVLAEIPKDAFSITREANHGLQGHLKLIREMCAGIDPDLSENKLFIRRAEIDIKKTGWHMAVNQTVQGSGVSRFLDTAARRQADNDLTVLSAVDDKTAQMCTGWERAEFAYRKGIIDQRLSEEHELARIYNGNDLQARRKVFHNAWRASRPLREARRPGFHNF